MKKEILITSGILSLSFFYDDKKMNSKKEKDFKLWIDRLSKSLESFLKGKELKDIMKSNGVKRVFLNLNLVTDYKIKKLNSTYRNKNKITDVLSFPMQENIRLNELDVFNGDLELGDLFICESICEKQALEFKLTFFEEFVHLASHGFLHLLGFDHEISLSEEKLMEKLEVKIIKKISKLSA